MYNRYIPQPDGSYRRNRIPDQPRPQPQRPACPPPEQPPEPPKAPPCPPPRQQNPRPQRQSPPRAEPESSVNSFLKRLLPNDFDTGDLLVILLLLLMAGDCPDEQNTALLTLVLYLYL